MTENIIKEYNISKLDNTILIITKLLKEIFKNPDFTGELYLNFYMGGLTGANKKESLKIK